MRVPFTQYLRPNGRATPVEIAITEDLDDKVKSILDNGLSFECEVLTTGQVSLMITSDDEDVAMEICENAPETVRPAVEKLIREFKL